MATNLVFWRKWHRWIGFPAALFLLFAATTGVLVAFTEFFGEEEALREATRDLVRDGRDAIAQRADRPDGDPLQGTESDRHDLHR